MTVKELCDKLIEEYGGDLEVVIRRERDNIETTESVKVLEVTDENTSDGPKVVLWTP